MPGPSAQYLSDQTTQDAEEMLDQLISDQATGADIINALDSAGLRIYSLDDIEEYEVDEEPEPSTGVGEIGIEPEEEEEEDEYEDEGGPMYDEELADSSPGPAMLGGNEGGNRDLIMEAVRFGVDEDKKKKSKSTKYE